MRHTKPVKLEPFTQQQQPKEVTIDPRKSSNIQIEYNVPFSKLNPRCEKENINPVRSLHVIYNTSSKLTII